MREEMAGWRLGNDTDGVVAKYPAITTDAIVITIANFYPFQTRTTSPPRFRFDQAFRQG
jgi:hypothetical protein